MDYETLAGKETIEKTIQALAERNVSAEVVKSGAEALEKIKALIPRGASVNNGTSTTLEQIGYVEYLKSGAHGWNNLKEVILTEKDPDKQSLLRKQAVVSDYYVGSVHAVAETGEYVIGSNSGSQLPHIVFTSSNLIFIVSTKKIVPDLAAAIKRLEEHVVPQEDARMKKMTEGKSGTRLSKELIVRFEPPYAKRTIRMIFVEENLGF